MNGLAEQLVSIFFATVCDLCLFYEQSLLWGFFIFKLSKVNYWQLQFYTQRSLILPTDNGLHFTTNMNIVEASWWHNFGETDYINQMNIIAKHNTNKDIWDLLNLLH